MDTMTEMENHKLLLTPLDHIMPRCYSPKLLYFPLSHPDIACTTSKLRSSLHRLFETLPILSGTVQQAHQSEQSGSLCVGAPWNTVDDVLRVSDLTSSDLDFENLRQTHFPMTTSAQYEFLSVLKSRANPLGVENPVMIAQINFIRNGMLLVLFLHHSFMDGMGGSAVIGLWAALCRGANGPEIGRGEMMNRERLMLGDEAGRWEEFREYVKVSEACGSGPGFLGRAYNLALSSLRVFSKRKSSGSLLSPKDSRKEVESDLFFISRSKLATLKSDVSASIASAIPSPSDSKSPSYISTNDAFSALLFACVTEARKSVKPKDTRRTIPLGVTVSGRRLLNPPLPEDYVGNMNLCAYLDVPFRRVTVKMSDVATIALQIRGRLLQLDDTYVNRLIGALRTVDDISKVALACRSSGEWEFVVTSWRGQGYYGMDWGGEIGAKCERLRIPKAAWPSLDGLNVIFPELEVENVIGSAVAGGEVVVTLEKGAMQRLKGMEEWTRWAQWRCS